MSGSTVSPITTHVLDLASGKPGKGIRVFLRVKESRARGDASEEKGAAAGRGEDGAGGAAGVGAAWREIGRGVTDADGRSENLLTAAARIEPGTYSLTFDTSPSPSSPSKEISSSLSFSFFPEITITFAVTNPSEHYHIPLLLSPFGYSTYRGS